MITETITRTKLPQITRRSFLQGTGMLVVTIGLGKASRVWAATGHFPDPPIDQVSSYLALGKDGSVTVFTGRMDMGTGNRTCFAQFAADELDVSMDRITVVAGDTALTPDGGKTTASDAIPIGGQPIRVSAATARKKLVELASEQLGTPVGQLVVNDGVVSVQGDPSKSVSYGDLIGDQRFDIQLTVEEVTQSGPILKIPEGVTLKTPEQFKVIGQPVPRIDMRDRIIAGNFCHKVRRPGMLYGRTIFPATPGSKLVSVDESSVSDAPGLVKVVVKGDFVGVVCEREEQAIEAMRKLAVRWTEWSGLPGNEDLHSALRNQPIVEDQTRREEGDIEGALAGAAKTISATYELPFYSHAMMAPTCAVADVHGDVVTVWSGTQRPRQTQRDIAQMLGLPEENVRVIWVQEAGSYGRLASADAAFDAVLLSQAVGRPVRVQWMREQEFAWQPHQPPMVFDVRGGIDAQGNIVAVDTEQWLSSTRESARFNQLAWILIGEAPGNDELRGAQRGVDYSVPNERMRAHYVKPILRGLYMRSPGGFHGTFAFESFMDELAAAAALDPVEFRLRHLTDERHIAVLQAAARKAGWETRPSPGPEANGESRIASGRGIAATLGRTQVATVVDVDVDRETGRVRVKRAVVAHDVGLIVNPDGLINQIEQATIQGTSRSLMEEVKLDRSKVLSEDWFSYPIIKFSEVPSVEIELLNRPDLPPGGAGEPATNPLPAAIANAIFDATGVRIRRLPLTPERVKAALNERA